MVNQAGFDKRDTSHKIWLLRAIILVVIYKICPWSSSLARSAWFLPPLRSVTAARRLHKYCDSRANASSNETELHTSIRGQQGSSLDTLSFRVLTADCTSWRSHLSVSQKNFSRPLIILRKGWCALADFPRTWMLRLEPFRCSGRGRVQFPDSVSVYFL